MVRLLVAFMVGPENTAWSVRSFRKPESVCLLTHNGGPLLATWVIPHQRVKKNEAIGFQTI